MDTIHNNNFSSPTNVTFNYHYVVVMMIIMIDDSPCIAPKALINFEPKIDGDKTSSDPYNQPTVKIILTFFI